MKAANQYDILGRYAAMDAQQMERGRSWRQVADATFIYAARW